MRYAGRLEPGCSAHVVQMHQSQLSWQSRCIGGNGQRGDDVRLSIQLQAGMEMLDGMYAGI